MKNLFTAILLVLLLMTAPCFASSITVHENGYVGIGASNPLAPLEIKVNELNRIFRFMQSDGFSGYLPLITTDESGSYPGLQLAGGGNRATMTIASNHNVGIGITSPQALLHVIGSTTGTQTAQFGSGTPGQIAKVDIIANSGTNAFQVWHDGQLSVPRFLVKRDGKVGIGKSSPSYLLDVNGTIRGNNVSPSDIRWKTNIHPIENSLDKVSQLRGVNYEWTDPAKGVGNQIGVIAQEVEEVFPEAVSTDNQGYKSVAYLKLVGPLIEAVKELKEENTRLKMENEKLRRNDDYLISRMNEIEALIKNLK